MVKGCLNKCMKLILCLFNLAFVILASIMLYFGVQELKTVNKYADTEMAELLKVTLIMAITVASFTLITAFLGCCGAAKENPRMLSFYVFIVATLVLLEVIGVGFLYYNKSQEHPFAEKILYKTFKKYRPNEPHHKWTQFADLIQQELHCCGVINSTHDWMTLQPTEYSVLSPSSCCSLSLDETTFQANCSPSSDLYFQEPCANRLVAYFRGLSGPLTKFLVGAAATKLVAICFAVCLKNTVR